VREPGRGQASGGTARSGDGQRHVACVAVMFAEMGEPVDARGPRSVFDAVTRTVIRQVAGSSAASLTRFRSGTFSTVSATDERARGADGLQYELDSGPCVDAILREPLYNSGDLPHDPRWPAFGARAHAEFGWSTMLSVRLNTDLAVDDGIAGLNIYADHPDAFDDAAINTGLLLATHAAVAVAAQISAERSAHLLRALESNREIGVAMGVLMNQHRVTRAQAFDLLRVASQRANRTLHEVATDVADTGALPAGLLKGERSLSILPVSSGARTSCNRSCCGRSI